MSRCPSNLEERERMLDIIAGVGPRGFLLTEPDCNLILEGTGSSLGKPLLSGLFPWCRRHVSSAVHKVGIVEATTDSLFSLLQRSGCHSVRKENKIPEPGIYTIK